MTRKGNNVRQHYVPVFVLKNFAVPEDESNGKKHWKLYHADLVFKNVGLRNCDRQFYGMCIYDVPGEVPERLEKKFNSSLESPMKGVLDKLRRSAEENGHVRMRREELDFLKKYLLVQMYRNPRNMGSYERSGDGGTERLKRMMEEVLDRSMCDLRRSKDLDILSNTLKVSNSFFMFVRTDGEFLINDLGHVSERTDVVPECLWESPSLLWFSTISDGVLYHDNFLFFPLSYDFGVLMVSPYWKERFMDCQMPLPDESFLLSRHFAFPDNNYVNKEFELYLALKDRILSGNVPADKMKELGGYQSPDDIFDYEVQLLDSSETGYLNSLMVNEASKIGFRSVEKMKEYLGIT